MHNIQSIYNDFVIVEKSVTVRAACELLRQHSSRLLIQHDGRDIVGVCNSQDLLLQMGDMNSPVQYSADFARINEGQIFTNNLLIYSYLLIQNEQNEIIGWIDRDSVEIQYLKQHLSDDVRELTTDLEAIVDSVYDEILVVDAQGTILRMSIRSAHNLWGINPAQVIGMNILDLEEKGWFKPTVTRKVLDEKKKISVIQENRFGKVILAVGNPIFNRKKQIERIVIASRDITEVTKLENELERVKAQTEKYKQEIENLRKYHMIGEKQIVYRSEQMRDLMSKIERIAGVESTVAIYGESGVGKELIVHAIHHLSPRAKEPFVKINCSSVPENLLESELFGYEKGAFTGALVQGKKGLFELANHGTLFLDEVAEMPLNLQVKLLRVIQEREIMKVGGSRTIPVDVRIVAATNKNLEEMVAQGAFREDLYYRLHVIPIYVPALRERIEDIEPLVYYFLDYFNQKFGLKKHFSEDAMEMMKAYHWPGNVRQLQNVIERALVVTSTDLVTANEIANFLQNRKASVPPIQVNSIVPLQQAVEMTETQLIQMALSKYKTITKVAEALEVSQPTMSRRFQKLLNQLGKKDET